MQTVKDFYFVSLIKILRLIILVILGKLMNLSDWPQTDVVSAVKNQ